MSKAFTKEETLESQEAELDSKEEPNPLPADSKNYITPKGAERLRSELRQLVNEERPKLVDVVAWAASNGDRSENADYIYGKRRLREIDRRIRFLTKRLENAEIVNPVEQKTDQIRFGATVTLRNSKGEKKVYRIVGIDETDGKVGKISWISPLGRALLKATVGQELTVQLPRGEEEYEVLSIEYLPID